MKKTTFGIKSLSKQTPKWAIWIFRVYFYLSSITAIALNTFSSIPDSAKITILEILAFSNMAVHLLAQMIGWEEGPVDENSYS